MVASAFLSRSLVLRLGFALVLGLLVATILTAYRVQEGVSEQSARVYKDYFVAQEKLGSLNWILWAGSIRARDVFLNPAPNRHGMYLERVAQLRAESRKDLDELVLHGASAGLVAQLRTNVEDMLTTLERIPVSTLREDTRFQFLQQEIVPRRRAAAAILDRIAASSRTAFQKAEADFAQSRRDASETLMKLLALQLVFGMGVAIYSIRRAEHLERKTQEQLKQVSAARDELERLSARLMDIQEQERTRLSRELHDDVVQNLAVLKMEVIQANAAVTGLNGKVSERLARARDIADRTMASLRNTMLLLRPSLLDDLGLSPAVQWLAEDFERRTGVRCRVTDATSGAEFDDAVKTGMFRVIQEALRNCEKHAGASEVTVRMSYSESQLAVEVLDNGCGFEPREMAGAALRQHFGLLGMRERAIALGGRLTVGSAPGAGTAVRLMIPVQAAAPAPAKYMEKNA